jgi:tetratricopeptide (TPR) repeat protein
MIHMLLWACLILPPQIQQQSASPDVEQLVQAGVEAEGRGEMDRAIVSFRKAADLAPNTPDVFLQLGNAYMKNHDYAAALAPLKHASDLGLDTPVLHQLLGYALLAEGYPAEAIPHLKIIQDDAALGIAELQNNQPAESVTNLQAALAKSPDDPDLLLYLSRAATALSGQSLDRLLAVAPASARAHQAAGQTDFEMKLYLDAVQEYQKAIALRPDLPGLHLELGQVYAANSEWAEAEEQFRAEAKLQPGSAEAAYRLGNALLQEGKMKEAVKELRLSDALRPDMPETLYALGKAAALDDPSGAELPLKRVVELEKDSPLAAKAYLALAGIHRRQGKSELTAEDMKEYKRIQALTASPQP